MLTCINYFYRDHEVMLFKQTINISIIYIFVENDLVSTEI